MPAKNLKVFALIPARGGSKGIPHKNLRNLQGNPLISYSIKYSLESDLITKTYCSTDSPEIAKVAEKLGAQVPFLRPPSLAQDLSTDYDVFYHFCKWLRKENNLPDLIVHLRPTSPARTKLMLNEMINKLERYPELDCVRTVIESPKTPYKMWFVDQDELRPVIRDSNLKEPYNMARQSLPKTYLQSGTIDVIRTNTILEKNSMTGDRIGAHIIPSEFFIDIDSPEDLLQAQKSELLFKS